MGAAGEPTVSRILGRMPAQLGVQESRCRFEFVSASEDAKFVDVIPRMVDTVRALGPLNVAHFTA